MTRRLPQYPKYVTEKVSKTDFDCLSCGACCAPAPCTEGESISDGYTDLSAKDILRLKPQDIEKGLIRSPEDDEFYFRLTDHPEDGLRCIMLNGKIGERAPCSIYDRRPTTCSVFVMGSKACMSARRERGMSNR